MRVLSLLAVVSFAFVLVGCAGFGGSVDDASPSFVDREAAGTIDSDKPQDAGSPVDVINATDEDFTAPPANWTQNATISIEEKQSLFGRDVAKVWVWNDRGSANLLIPEGTGASHGGLKVSISVPVIGTEDGEPRVQVVVGGQSAILKPRQEVLLNGTWVFLSDVFLSSAESRR